MARWTLMYLLVVLLSLVALAACQEEPDQLNPEGYPPVPEGRAPAPAPTAGGAIPTPVGAELPPGAPQQEGAEGASVVGPGAADPGIYGAMNGTGSARTTPTPSPTETPEPAESVTITEAGFDPQSITISSGETVIWTNTTRTPQTITADPARAEEQSHVALPEDAEPWNSGVVNPGEDYVQTFDIPGDYVYFSVLLEQQGVTGEITVEP